MNKQEMIELNDKIKKDETYVMDRIFFKKDNEETMDKIKKETQAKVEAESEVSLDKSLSNEKKRQLEVEKRLKENKEYVFAEVVSKNCEKDIQQTVIDISYNKRLLQIEVAFKGED